MQLISASNTDAWAVAEQLLLAVVNHLNETGRSLWQRRQVAASALAQSYDLSQLYFLADEERPIGLVFLQEADPLFWPEASDKAIYVHKLAVHPDFIGCGYGERALQEIIRVARGRGLSYVRLDCDDRPELHRFYRQCGFDWLDYREVGQLFVARYQLKLA